MEYDFDEIIRREGSGCIKYDEPQAKGKLPLWVADMDFATPPFIMDALRERLSHPVLGYPTVPSDYYPMISRWIKYLHGWDVRSGHIRYVPGIVKGIGIALNCFKLLFLAAVLFGALNEADLVWTLADIGVGSMAWINVISILILSPIAFKSLKEYEKLY